MSSFFYFYLRLDTIPVKTAKRIADIIVMIIKAGIIANDSLTKNPTNVQKSICMFLTLTS
tara:strand:- start:170 stop:349 length:180 start_codon:yes stop_codon:yes gene_type:complete